MLGSRVRSLGPVGSLLTGACPALQVSTNRLFWARATPCRPFAAILRASNETSGLSVVVYLLLFLLSLSIAGMVSGFKKAKGISCCVVSFFYLACVASVVVLCIILLITVRDGYLEVRGPPRAPAFCVDGSCCVHWCAPSFRRCVISALLLSHACLFYALLVCGETLAFLCASVRVPGVHSGRD